MVTGTRYLGLDGQWHGSTSVTDSSGFTQNNFYSKNPNAGGTSKQTGPGKGQPGVIPNSNFAPRQNPVVQIPRKR